MRHFRIKPWILLSVGCGLLWLPAPVQASCGDYVTMKSPGTKDSHDSKQTSHQTQSTSSKRDLPTEKPCPGPGCSEHQLPLVPVSVAPQQINPDKALSLLELSLTEPGRQHW